MSYILERLQYHINEIGFHIWKKTVNKSLSQPATQKEVTKAVDTIAKEANKNWEEARKFGIKGFRIYRHDRSN